MMELRSFPPILFACASVHYLRQRLDAGVNVPTGNLGDDKVDCGRRAVVEVIKVRRDRAHPSNTKTDVNVKVDNQHLQN